MNDKPSEVSKRIADELSRKHDPQMLTSLAFIRSPDGVLLTSIEARMSEWEEKQ